MRGGAAWVGPSSQNSRLFAFFTDDQEPEFVREARTNMLRALETALAGRLTVRIVHPDDSGLIEYVHVYSSGF
jgi:hypothetical protein